MRSAFNDVLNRLLSLSTSAATGRERRTSSLTGDLSADRLQVQKFKFAKTP